MATPHPYVCTLSFRTLNAVYNAQDCMVPGCGIPLATLRYYFMLNEQLATDDAKTQEFLASGPDGARCAHCRRRLDEHRGDDVVTRKLVIYCQAMSLFFWALLIAAAAYSAPRQRSARRFDGGEHPCVHVVHRSARSPTDRPGDS
jgi:hypothetical protein